MNGGEEAHSIDDSRFKKQDSSLDGGEDHKMDGISGSMDLVKQGSIDMQSQQ